MPTPLVYWMPVPYPSPKAHAIQVTRTVQALAREREVHLVVQRRPRPLPWREELRAVYGVEPAPGLRLLELPPSWLREPLVPLALAAVARRTPARSVFYARRYPIADALLRYRFLHRRPVLFESHKKEGFRKEDRVDDSPFAPLREELEAGNHSFALVRRVYEGADGLVFLHEHSLKAAQARLRLRRAVACWHGLDAERAHTDGERPEGLVFTGSLGEGKLFDLIPYALTRAQAAATVDVFGGSADEIARGQARAADLGLAGRLRFRGRLPWAELRRRLPGYRAGLLTMEGLKVVDYLECGLLPVLPRVASFAELFDERDVAFFRPDDVNSLARAIDGAHAAPHDPARARRLLAAHPIERRVRAIGDLADGVSP